VSLSRRLTSSELRHFKSNILHCIVLYKREKGNSTVITVNENHNREVDSDSGTFKRYPEQRKLDNNTPSFIIVKDLHNIRATMRKEVKGDKIIRNCYWMSLLI